MPVKHLDMFTAGAAATAHGRLLHSSPGTFLKSPAVACDAQAIREHYARAVFLRRVRGFTDKPRMAASTARRFAAGLGGR